MSQENVEVVKAGFDAWNAGDMDTAREMYDPDAVLKMAEGWPEPGPFVGYTVRDGRVCKIEFFWEHSGALEAVGLRK